LFHFQRINSSALAARVTISVVSVGKEAKGKFMGEGAEQAKAEGERNHNNEQFCFDATKLSHRSSLPKILSAGGGGGKAENLHRARAREGARPRRRAGLKEKCC
jgi:hypothetical protein